MLDKMFTTKMSANKKHLQNRFAKIRSKNGKFSKLMAICMTTIIVLTMLCATVVMAALTNNEDKEPITLYSNGEIIILDNKPFIQNNMTYFPLRETFEKLGVFEIEGNSIIWNEGTIDIKVAENKSKEPVSYTIKIGRDTIGIKHTHDVRLTVALNQQPSIGVELCLPEEKPLLIGDKTYVPYTFIDYMLNRGLGIRNNQEVFDFMFIINSENPSAFISQGFVWPCDGHVSCSFGERTHPISNEKIKHNGIDIAVPEGTEVKSSIYGTVTETGYDAEKGYFVIIERDNIQTVYTNLTNNIHVKKGDNILRGEKIGEVGNTGKSTGAHLHFEVIINGEYFNPELIS